LYISGQDTTWYYDFQNVEPGEYVYSVTAYYDLTPYGLPGQFGESESVSDTINISCFSILPFVEDWDLASFLYNDWDFEPSQGNWDITVTEGNPMPAAIFKGNPQQLNYSFRLESIFHCQYIYFCASLYLDFDYKLEDLAAGSTDSLIIEVYYDSVWHPVLALTNQGSTGWIHQSVDLSEMITHPCRIGFRATGENSENFEAWLIDNIIFYAVCHPPLNTTLSFSGENRVTLNWEAPCDLSKADSAYFTYRIMRTDSSGLPPYADISGFIFDTFFVDLLDPSQLTGHFHYYIMAEHNLNYFLCGASGDTVAYTPVQNISLQLSPEPSIFPNPAYEQITVKDVQAGADISVVNYIGQPVLNSSIPEKGSLVLDVSDWPSGIYLIKMVTAGHTVIRKITVLH